MVTLQLMIIDGTKNRFINHIVALSDNYIIFNYDYSLNIETILYTNIKKLVFVDSEGCYLERENLLNFSIINSDNEVIFISRNIISDDSLLDKLIDIAITTMTNNQIMLN